MKTLGLIGGGKDIASLNQSLASSLRSSLVLTKGNHGTTKKPPRGPAPWAPPALALGGGGGATFAHTGKGGKNKFELRNYTQSIELDYNSIEAVSAEASSMTSKQQRNKKAHAAPERKKKQIQIKHINGVAVYVASEHANATPQSSGINTHNNNTNKGKKSTMARKKSLQPSLSATSGSGFTSNDPNATGNSANVNLETTQKKALNLSEIIDASLGPRSHLDGFLAESSEASLGSGVL
uniref:Uncharacterized protein n=1 Tax=Heterosigma akashiwo TaxID=2829 RepID=A0A7S3UT36_HETAK